MAPLAPAPLAAAGQAGHRWPFGVGTRGFVLLGAGLIWILPAWFDRRTLLLLAVWDLLLLAAWLLDLRRLAPPAQIRVTRSWPGPLGLGTPACVALELRQDGPTPIQARLIDFVASDLRREPPAIELTAFAGRDARVEYDVLPRERGDMTMGVAIVRYESPWGLAARWASVPLAQTVRVYPNLRDAQKQALFLVRSKQISIERLRTRERGAGRDFESLRDYQDGDDPRDICWSATARRAKLVTKRYQPERSQVVWILVDAGRLLRARVAGHTKLDYGVNSALALAQVAMLSGDRVGLLAYGRRPQQRVAPGRGASHLRTMVDALAAVRGESVEADHTAAASAVLSLQKRRALIVWLTEVAETAGVPEVIESSQRMAPRHVVFLALTRHPELATLASARPDSQREMYRVMAAQQTLERREELLHGLRQRGVLTLEQPPGELSAAVIDRYLSVKARNLL
jgi:uncharacterized protein (DUF58 family)